MILEETLHRVKKYFGDWYFEDHGQKSKMERSALYIARLGSYIARKFNQDVVQQRAASLAYTSILSLVPVSALFVFYFKTAGKLDAQNNILQEWVFKYFVAEAAQNVTSYLDQFVANIHTKTLGTVGAAGLLITAYLTFKTIEQSLNDIWRVRIHRSLVSRVQILSSVLIIVPTLLLGSFYVSNMIQKIKIAGFYKDLTTVMKTIFLAAPFLLTMVPFFVLFKFLPNTKVRWKPAMLAAMFASLLFEFAKSAFNFYVVNFVAATKIYGALGLIPILLIWIYLCWLIILLGVEVAYGIQNYEILHLEAMQRRQVGPLDVALHEEWALKIVRALAARFMKGEGAIGADEIAKDIGLKVNHVEDHLIILHRAKIVARVADDDVDSGYVFLRPIEHLTVAEIVTIFREQLGLPIEKPDPTPLVEGLTVAT